MTHHYGEGANANKRFATLQVCVRLSNLYIQPRMAIVLWVRGKRIKEEKQEAYDKRIDIFWQPEV